MIPRPPHDDPSPDHRRACVHLSFWTDFRSQPKRLRSIHTLRCVPTASSPAAQIDLHLSTLTIYRHIRAHARARVRGFDSTFTHLFSHTLDAVCLSAPASLALKPAGPSASKHSALSGTPAPFGTTVLSGANISRCRAPLDFQHLSASELAGCSLNTLTARVHIQRIVIEIVGSLVSDRTTLLELSRLPTRPPGLRNPQLSPLPPPSRKISFVRLAALPIR